MKPPSDCIMLIIRIGPLVSICVKPSVAKLMPEK